MIKNGALNKLKCSKNDRHFRSSTAPFSWTLMNDSIKFVYLRIKDAVYNMKIRVLDPEHNKIVYLIVDTNNCIDKDYFNHYFPGANGLFYYEGKHRKEFYKYMMRKNTSIQSLLYVQCTISRK